MRELKVHPIADRFPMMSDEELADLAASIKANGLRFPIIVDGEVLIDGRNRLAACKLAGIEPIFEELDGRDPIALIADVNLSRRNLTKGQAAMGYAFLYPEPAKAGRKKKNSGTRNGSETEPFSKVRLSEARSVLSFSPELAARVFAGNTPLDEALEEVEAARRKAEGDDARLDRLRKGAPDLAELVAEERMSLHEATAAWSERETRRRANYQAGVRAADWLSSEILGKVSSIIGGEASRSDSDPPIVVKPEALKQIDEAVSLLKNFCGRKIIPMRPSDPEDE